MPRSMAPSTDRGSALLARRPTKVAAIALANKIARVAWAMMAKGERYKEPVALASKFSVSTGDDAEAHH